MKKQLKWIWYVLWLLIAAIGGGGTLFSWMPRTDGMFYGGCAILITSVTVGILLVLLARGKTFKKAWLPAVIGGAVYAAVIAAVVYLCDEVIFKDCIKNYQPVHSSITVVVLNLVLMLAAVILIPKKYDPKLVWLKRIVALVLVGTAFALSGLPQNWWWGRYNYAIEAMYRVTAPVGFSTYTKQETTLVTDADFYVALDGSDDNDGSFEKPFATIEKARDTIRELDKSGLNGITVAIKAGEYRIGSIVFTEADSGTEECPITYCAYGDGEVILNAGVTLHYADFTKVSGTLAERLYEDARDHVYCIDLATYGITADDYGVMHAIGSYNCANKYDGYTDGYNCELFINEERQNIARYPNEGWLKTGEVLEEGEAKQLNSNPYVDVEGWDELRNPNGDTYAISKELADRVNSWATLDDVWMYGYFTADWAPSSSPVEIFDYEGLSIKNKFVAVYGPYEGEDGKAPYYFYNVFEELDAPGEWYLDRDTGILYIYETEDFANADMMFTLSEETMIVVEDANYLTFSGLTLQGARADAMSFTGDNNTVEYCLIKNVAGSAILMEGYNNLIANNEICKTGRGCVEISGGDKETLTSSNNRVYNNLIHDWGDINATQGIIVRGVGVLVDHNEIFHSIDVAINYGGNDHIIEYNLIYDMSLETTDGGAIYNANSWTDYGCIVRYNAIYNMGQPGFSTPNAIYLDNGLNGQTVYGNLLVNVPQNGIKVGGGRDNHVYNNVIINTTENGIYGIEAFYYGSMGIEVYSRHLPAWESSPKDTAIWQEAYPELAVLHFDESNQDDPNFIGNAVNWVNGNICVNRTGELGDVEGNQNEYADFSGNAVYTMDMLNEIFVDPENGNYHVKEDSIIYELIPDFEDLPIEKMGRE